MPKALSLNESKAKIVIFGMIIVILLVVNILGSRSMLPGKESTVRSTLQFFFSIPGARWPETESDAIEKIAKLLPQSLPQPSKRERISEIPLEKHPEPESLRLDRLIADAALQYGIDPMLIKAVIRIESGFDPSAVSPKGAMGLMQLMPETAKGLGVADPFDPSQNIEGGVKYLASLIEMFDGDPSLALAAYNAGPETVRRYQGLPPYEETQRFVARVMETYDQYKALIAKKQQ